MAKRPIKNRRTQASVLAGIAHDPKRFKVVARRRAARLKELGLANTVPFGGDIPPWLWLDPMHPYVEGKGWLELLNPSEVSRRWDTLTPFAGFEGIYEEKLPSSFAIVRPQAIIHIDPPGQYLVDIDLWGNCFDQPQTAFRVFGDQQSSITVDKAQDDRITLVVSGGWLSLHLDIPHDGHVENTGRWALHGVRVTPVG